MKKIIEFPTDWDEVRPAEWEYLLKLRQKLATKKGISLLDVKRDWCRYVLESRGAKINRYQAYILVNQLANTLDWMWKTDESGTVTLTFDSTVNLLPVWKRLLGPASHGADLTFGEFRTAVQMMNTYTTTHDVMYLQCLAGMLYRPVIRQKKEPFILERMNEYQQRVRKMPGELLWGIYVWFSSFCQFLFTGTFVIDGNEVCFSSLFEKKSENVGPSLGMNSILFSVAESGIFGNVADVDNTQLMQVMLKLLDDKQKADNLLKQTKK